MIIDLSNELSLESWMIPEKMEHKLASGLQTDKFDDIRKLMAPGDCLIADARSFKNIAASFVSTVMSTAMLLDRVPFSSIKLIEDSKNVIGYGVTNKYQFDRAPITDLSHIGSGALLRHKQLNHELATKLIKLSKSYQQVPYNVQLVVEGAVDRLLHTHWFEGDAEKEVKAHTPELFCSAVISKLYSDIGLQTITKPLKLYQVWPSDLLMSDYFDVVLYYQRKD